MKKRTIVLLTAAAAVVGLIVSQSTGKLEQPLSGTAPVKGARPTPTAMGSGTFTPAAPVVSMPLVANATQDDPALLPPRLLPITNGIKDAEGFETVVWPEGKPHYEGEPVVAKVTTGEEKRKLHLEVNQMGEFPRVQVGPQEKVAVALQFQSSKPGMPVALTAQDGGLLADQKMSQIVELDAQRMASFAFTSSANVGAHRVSIVTPKGEVKNLDFWVGELNTMRTTAQR